MDKTQYEMACAIVNVDCLGVGFFRDLEGKTCAIGGFYAAINPDWACDIDSEYDSVELVRSVKEVFGITEDQLWAVTAANDPSVNDDTVEARRVRVLNYLKYIYEADKPATE